jgi:hypothetical protein
MSISSDVLRVIIGDYFQGAESRRELEVIRARLAGGEPLDRIAEDYRDVPVEVLCAICRRPDVV